MAKCSAANCYYPENACALGCIEVSECPTWNASPALQTSEDAPSEGISVPWSGSALGAADFGFVSGREKPTVIGVVGAQNAGKTTMLAAWYLLLGQGRLQRASRKIYRSYSLSGWEAIASSLRWSNNASARFPPHTSSAGGRGQGLLHLAFERNEVVRDYLFTDAPGEWFQNWAVTRDAPEAEGARWVAEHSDAVLLIADRGALSGDQKGAARGSIQTLARRLSAERRGRPVALVWTKADLKIAPEMEEDVRSAVFRLMPDVAEFSVSIRDTSGSGDEGAGLAELFEWCLSTRRARGQLGSTPDTSFDPLFIFGKRA